MNKKILCFLAVIFILVCLSGAITGEEQPPQLIRLHVLANSDSAEDQALKLLVKDKVLAIMKDKFRNAANLEDSRMILLENLSLLENSAEEAIRAAGYNYPVQAIHGRFSFPTKYYGSFALPAGNYEAVRLVIGEGQGANWWCVLFPPLCIVDGKTTVEASAVTAKIKPAFKLAEVWREVVNML